MFHTTDPHIHACVGVPLKSNDSGSCESTKSSFLNMSSVLLSKNFLALIADIDPATNTRNLDNHFIDLIILYTWMYVKGGATLIENSDAASSAAFILSLGFF